MNLSGEKKVVFYFDFLSPYSYLGHYRLQQMRQEEGFLIEYRPLVLGILLGPYGIKGPGEIPAKRNYLLRMLLHQVIQQEIPFSTPEKLPFDSQYALRLAEAAKDFPSLEDEVVDSLWIYGWQRGHNYENIDALLSFLHKRNLPASELYEHSLQRPVSLRLKSNLQEAWQRQIFGVPSFWVEDRFFWGHDSLPMMLSFLQEKNLNLVDELFNQIKEKHHF